MFVLYLDEFGHDGIWDPLDPRHDHHPLFGLAGFALPGAACRDFDRAYLRLKYRYYPFEIEQHQRQGLRAERYEPKRLRSRRDREFSADTLTEIGKAGGVLFAQGITKAVGARSHNVDALYASLARNILTTFELFLRRKAGKAIGCGMIVMDQRNPSRDRKLLASVQRHIFSPTNQLRRVAETPLLVPSDWYHGVQAADTVARAAGAIFRARYSTPDKHARLAAQRLGGQLVGLAANWPWGSGTWSTIHVRPPRTDGPGPVSQERWSNARPTPLSAPLLDVAQASESRR